MKKLLSVFLSLVLCFALTLPAFAAQETPYEDSLYYTYEDYEIHYRVWKAEQPKGQIFMIHGFALSSYCFEELAKRMVEAGYTCVLADLPDFGYSSRDTAQTHKLPREDVMHALMVHLSSDPWYVAGHSMGGYITLALAEKYPESVKNILLYGTAGNSKNTAALSVIMTNPLFLKIMAPFMELMAKSDLLVRLLLVAGLGDAAYVKDYDVAKVTEPLRIPGTGAGAIYSFSMLPQTNFDAVKHYAPILYMNGDADNVIPAADRAKLREYLPDGSVDYIVKGGAHMFIENYADEAAQVTLAFLQENG